MSESRRTDGTVEIRSYRVCFDLERRIHKIDRWRVPLPYGVPMRGIGYAAVALALCLLLSALPVFGELLGMLHPALRLVALPIAAGILLARWRVDGRTASRAALAWLRFTLAPRRLSSFRPLARPEEVRWDELALSFDDRSSRLRRAVVQGPSRVLFRYPIRTASRGRELRVTQDGTEPQWRGTQVDLRPGQRLVIT